MFSHKKSSQTLLLSHTHKLQAQKRKDQIQSIKETSRQLLIQSLKQDYDRKITQDELGILNLLREHNEQINETDSYHIQHFISNYEQYFSYQFRNVFTEIVLNNFRKNKNLLIALIRIFEKCQQIQVLQQMQADKCIELLFSDNRDPQTQKVQHLYEILVLIYNLFVSIPNKNQFAILINYQQQIEQLGYHNPIVLLLTSSLASKEIYQPTTQCIQHYLESQLTFDQNEQDLLNIIKILIHYYKGRQLQDMPKFLCFIQSKFKQFNFSQSLKSSFLKTLINNFQAYTQQHKTQFTKMFLKFDIYALVYEAVHCGSKQNNKYALIIIFSALPVLSLQTVKELSQEYQLIEIIIQSLPIIDDINLLFQGIQSLFYIFQSDQRFLRKAQRLGIKQLIQNFQISRNVKISYLCSQLLQCYFGQE